MAVPWVVDKGLDKLLAQINAAAPRRSKVSDGSIGDPAHAAGTSEHNPEHPPPARNPDYQVDARDFTQDPAHGADMEKIAEALRASKDVRIKYVIWNRRIFSGRKGPSPWVWRPYSGTSDPHTGHLHISAEDDTHDQTQDWQIGLDMPLDGLDRAQVNNAEHYLQSLVQMSPSAAGISNVAKNDLVVPNALTVAIRTIQADLVAIKARLAEPPPAAVTVDAAGVANALVANTAFVQALAKANSEEIDRRMDS